MKKFMLLYVVPTSAGEQMQNMDPEMGKEIMDAWMAWFGKHGSAIVDGGEPLVSGANFTATTSAKPQLPQVGGYSILQAADIQQVKTMLDGHPHLMTPGGSIEVLEVIPVSP